MCERVRASLFRIIPFFHFVVSGVKLDASRDLCYKPRTLTQDASVVGISEQPRPTSAICTNVDLDTPFTSRHI